MVSDLIKKSVKRLSNGVVRVLLDDRRRFCGDAPCCRNCSTPMSWS